MALAQEEKEEIQALIEQVISSRPEVKNANVRYELDLRERTVRVEEELKHQRQLMMEGFNRMDKHFEKNQQEMNQRFEQVDKRFEQAQLEMNQRFEQVQLEMTQRFERVDNRFSEVQHEMNHRFELISKRLDRFMFWSLGLTISSAIFVVTYLK